MGTGSYRGVKESRMTARWDGTDSRLLRGEAQVIMYLFKGKITLAALQKMDYKESKPELEKSGGV